MHKKTEDLVEILKSKRDLDEFLSQNTAEMLFSSVPEMVNYVISCKKLETSQVVKDSALGNYAYEIMNGKKGGKRDKLLMLCFGLKLTAEEASKLIRIGSHAALYVKNPRDAVIMYALDHGKTVSQANDMLTERKMPALNEKAVI